MASNIGRNINQIYSDFRALDWVHPALKTYSKFLWMFPGYYYIDEKDTLIYQPDKKPTPAEEPVDFIYVTEYMQFAQIDGIWYFVELRDKVRWFGWSITNKFREHVRMVARRTGVKLYSVIKTKRQLSHRELKTLGLSNTNTAK